MILGEDKQKIVFGLNFGKATALLFLLVIIYMYGFLAIKTFGLDVGTISWLLSGFNVKIPIFAYEVFIRALIFVLILLCCLFTPVIDPDRFSKRTSWVLCVVGAALFWSVEFLSNLSYSLPSSLLYILLSITGFLLLFIGCSRFDVSRWMKRENPDVFNDLQESFPQCEVKIENPKSFNYPTVYYCRNKHNKLERRNGWVNVVEPCRAMLVLGTPGSGKSYSIIEPTITQAIQKGYAMYLYDYKFPALAKCAYGAYKAAIKNQTYGNVVPKMYVINFDNPALSHRCNPLSPRLIKTAEDAIEASLNIMLALNKKWIKDRDFFADSAINIFAAIIIYLKYYQNGRYCTFAHAIELLSADLNILFPMLLSNSRTANLTKPFSDAFNNGAMEQLQGQMASAQIPLTRFTIENMYWVCTGDDFELTINDPTSPKVVITANNGRKEGIYGTLLTLYNSQLVKEVNQPGKMRCALIVDELPTMYFKGIEKLIATARSNEVAIILSAQDQSQLIAEYGKEESDKQFNTIGTIVSGQVQGDTAKLISALFGKKIQQRTSYSLSDNPSISVSEHLDSMLPESKISNFSQGMFCGRVADTFKQKIDQKLFYGEVMVEKSSQTTEEDIPILTQFFKKDALPEDIDDLMMDFKLMLKNADIFRIAERMLEKCDEHCIYHFDPTDFEVDIHALSAASLEVLSYSFDVENFNRKNFNRAKKILRDKAISELTQLEFIYKISDSEYFVRVFMASKVRQNYKAIREDVVMISKSEVDRLINDPGTRNLFNQKYIAEYEKQKGQLAFDERKENFKL